MQEGRRKTRVIPPRPPYPPPFPSPRALADRVSGGRLILRNLGIDDMYFMLESVESISNNILALYGAKISAYTKNDNDLVIDLERETDDGAIYIHTSRPGVSQLSGPQHERRIDSRYLDATQKDTAYRLESYRSLGTVSNTVTTQLRCYFVAKCNFVNPEPTLEQQTDIRQISDRLFLEKASENTLEVYASIIKNVLQRTGPVIEMYETENSRERRVVIGYRRGLTARRAPLSQRSTQTFFSAMSDLYHYYDLYSTRKYVEQFSNGVTVLSVYLNQVANSKAPPIEHSIYQVIKEASLIYCLPTTPLQYLFQTNKLSGSWFPLPKFLEVKIRLSVCVGSLTFVGASICTRAVQEAIYGYVGWIFAQHFLNRLGSEYTTLLNVLDTNNSSHIEVLTKIKKRLRTDTFTREYILDIIKMYPELIKVLYVNFAMTHYINPAESVLGPSLSYQRLQTGHVLTEQELTAQIRKATSNLHEFMVFEAFLTFNRHVLKTNFYQPTKVALSFRLNPAFLPEIEYPNKVYGMFLVIGSEFRGFHLRFRDIARGGIRVIRSRNKEAYSINLRSLFDENYALAATQQRKNKDIPEGGSKGTILLDPM
ncbi:MAG: hypothetical protein BJ554DRAFT_4148, partial [Olpidium bornovanus]